MDATVAFEGIKGRPMDLQVQIAATDIVGLVDMAVAELEERARRADGLRGAGDQTPTNPPFLS